MTPALDTSCSAEIRVPPDWSLVPSGVTAGERFRLLFVTANLYDATSKNIADYNTLVQTETRPFGFATQRYSGGFRALASTGAVNARANTCTRASDDDARVYWLGTNTKVADDYADLYDGSWDNFSGATTAVGRSHGGFFTVWTGTTNAGSTSGTAPLGGTASNARTLWADPLDNVEAVTTPKPFHNGDSPNTEERYIYGLSQVFVAPARPTGNAIAILTAPGVGDTYRRGETIEFEVTFTEAVAVRGAPQIGLVMREAVEGEDDPIASEFVARYLRGSGTTKLVFAYTVAAGDRATGGIALAASDQLRTNGGWVRAATTDGTVIDAGLDLSATDDLRNGGTVHRIDGSLEELRGGVCGRTPEVRDAIVRAVAEAASCAEVTAAHLAGGIARNYEGRMALTVEGLTSIRSGDLAGLSGLQRLRLEGRGIDTLPVGLFDGLESLERLDVRVGLTHLPKDIFRGLGRVTILDIEGAGVPRNRIRAGGLPEGIFEPLSRGTKYTRIFDNPGYPFASLAPRAADAGPGGVLSAGQTVTLGGPGNDGGIWGSNVFYDWWQHPAGTVTLQGTVALVGELRADQDNLATAPDPTFTVPVVAEETELRLSLRLDALGQSLDGSASPNFDAAQTYYLRSPTSEAVYTIRALAVRALGVISQPAGDAYRPGETVEFAVTFGDTVVVDGTPRLGFGLSDSGTNRHADYLRGSNTRTLVFAYTVEGADPSDADGIRVGDNALELNGGTILSVYGAPALLALTGFADDSAHPVDTSPGASVPTGGICDRTPLIRDRLLAVVRASEGDDTLTCADVGTAHLAALTGRLEIHGGSNGNLDGGYLSGLRAGDFNGLTGITELSLSVHRLREVPSGVFDPLTGLEGLVLQHNRPESNGGVAGDALTGLPPGLFDRLPGLKSLGLCCNALDALPARIFEPLRDLETLQLAFNPGTARFAPTARAGEDLEVVSGGTVRLGVEGAELGYEDPWGDNVRWRWRWRVDVGEGGTLSSDRTARASFTAPATGGEEVPVHVLLLRVQRVGQGLETEPHFASDTVTVRVLAGPFIESAAFIGLPGGRIHALPIYAGGEWIEVALRFNREVRVDTGAGVPSASLDVGGGMRTAVYRRGSGTRSLVFGYRVRSGDDDRDGVMLRADSLALNGAAIVGVSDGGSAGLRHAGLEGGAGRGVLGRLDVPGTGVCGRSPAVAAAIVARVREENESVASCADVLLADLQGLAGTLDVSAQIAAHGRMTALESGDFADLGALTGLDLDDHALAVIPAGVFDPLTSLTSLSISYNQTERGGLRTLPAGLFDRLTGLTTLRLGQNALETLPARIFEKLTKLETLTLDGNPGGARLLPDAVAGPAGGLGAKAGETVTLGGARAADPWGSNATYAWRQMRGTTVDLSAEDVASPTFTAPHVVEDETLVFELSLTGAGGSPGTANAHTATERVEVAVEKAATITALAVTSEPVDGGDAYHAGETIEVSVTFSKPVTVRGTPLLALTVGTGTREARYAGATSGATLVFRYGVDSADRDSDGISVAANALALDGGTITDSAATDAAITHSALAAEGAHKVHGGTASLMGGVCARTPEVRKELLARVRIAEANDALTCADVTRAALQALTGKLDLTSRTITALREGDFADLAGITELDLSENALAALAANVFEGLGTSVQTVTIRNAGLRTVAPGVFDALTGVATLDLSDNSLAGLPPRTFEKLVGLDSLSLDSSTQSVRFAPIARAGDDREILRSEAVTLGVEGAGSGFDDPWGSNVIRSWTRVSGTGGTLAGNQTARATFTAPDEAGDHTFRLTVRGRGAEMGDHTSTDEVRVRVRVRVTDAVRAGPLPTGATVSGSMLTLTYDEDLRETNPASATGKGAVFVAVLGAEGARRSIETARGTGARASGRTITMTLDSPAGHGQSVTLTYLPDNATPGSRVRDARGNLASDFAGLRVQNETPRGPHVQAVAFAGAAGTYATGDVIGVDVIFSESVTVSGAPTIELAIGTATRLAAWKAGQFPGRAHRFEYTIVEGDLDTDGVAVRANTLALPSGASLTTAAASAAVALAHGAVHDPARRVDAVPPAIAEGEDAAIVAGPVLTLTWTEALDPDSIPDGAGGFTVRIGGTAEPAPRAVELDALDRRILHVRLARSVPQNASNVTVDHTPGATPLRDLLGNAVAAFLARAVTPRAGRNSPATGRVAISGTATVGETLTATVIDVADPDGLPEPAAYSFQWDRIEEHEPTSIATSTEGPASDTYTLTAAEAGKTIRVRVEFPDRLGTTEGFRSDTYPATGRVMWAADAQCAEPDLAGRELLWTARVGVVELTDEGAASQQFGYQPTRPGATLSDTTFTHGGSEYTVDHLAVVSTPSSEAGRLIFSTTAETQADALRLHVCDEPFDTNQGANNSGSPNYDYTWTSTGLDWSGHGTRRVYLSRADTSAPGLRGRASRSTPRGSPSPITRRSNPPSRQRRGRARSTRRAPPAPRAPSRSPRSKPARGRTATR